MRVLITGANGPLGKRLCHLLSNEEVITSDLPENLESPKSRHELIKRVGKVDVVINNAKVNGWEHLYELGALATKAVVNVGSVYGVLGGDPNLYQGTTVPPTPPEYVAQKGAMVALTKHMATILTPTRVNCVCPGGIFRDQDPVFVRKYCQKVPLGRMATEDEIAIPIIFLASDESSYITGQVLMVDGGLSAW